MREPATSAATFCSSLTFQSMNCSMSGWSTSTITILAARRVVPPDLMAPAARSPILRNDIKPEDLPRGEVLVLAADLGEVGARAGAVLEDPRLAGPEVHDAALVDEVVGDGLDEAGVRLGPLVGAGRVAQLAAVGVDEGVALRGTGDAVGPVQAAVEPLRRVGGGALRRHHEDELVVEGAGVVLAIEVAVPPAPGGPRPGEAVEDLAGVALAGGVVGARGWLGAPQPLGDALLATPSSSAATPVLRKYFCAMMSTATCDQSAGMRTPGPRRRRSRRG